mgnify:CR=1 FL=1
MKTNLGKFVEVTATRLNQLVRELEQIFDRIPDPVRKTYSTTLNFAAPGAVPGVSAQSVTITGIEMGDTVVASASIAVPAGFIPLMAEVSAADTVSLKWVQISGVAADPDGAGATYRIDVFRH